MKTVEAILLGLAVAAAANSGAQAPGWTAVQPGLVIELPRDHGAHLATLTEWWYLTGIARTAEGEELGFQLTFFRRGIAPAPPAAGASALRARHVLAAHLAIADIRHDRLLHAQRLRRVDGLLAGATEKDLAVWLDGWALRRNESDVLTATASDAHDGLGLALTLRPEKPPVLHGSGGYSRKGREPGNASAYVSWPRLAANGTLTVAGRRLTVTGEAWFDHEWGTSQLGEGIIGWDWFGLRLVDGRELMAFVLRGESGEASPYSAATVVEADGATRTLTAREFSIEPVAWWTSGESGASYPSRWRVRVPPAGLDLEVVPRLRGAEIDARRSTGTIYWEGPVAVSGSARGEGYAELTGYAGSMAGAFAPPPDGVSR